MNRTVRYLREKGILSWRSGTVTIEDWERLAATAEFDPAYLHLDRQPR